RPFPLPIFNTSCRFFFPSRRRHTIFSRDWSSDVCSSDLQYVAEVYPPSAALPPEKLGGMGYIEYEPGKRAIHAPVIRRGMWRDGYWMPPGFDGNSLIRSRPAVADGRIYLLNSGVDSGPRQIGRSSSGHKVNRLHWLRTDGSTEYD